MIKIKQRGKKVRKKAMDRKNNFSETWNIFWGSQKFLEEPEKFNFAYSLYYSQTLAISRVLIGRHLIFCLLTWPTCCNSPRKCTPVKYKARQKAGFPIVIQTIVCQWNHCYLKSYGKNFSKKTNTLRITLFAF